MADFLAKDSKLDSWIGCSCAVEYLKKYTSFFSRNVCGQPHQSSLSIRPESKWARLYVSARSPSDSANVCGFLWPSFFLRWAWWPSWWPIRPQEPSCSNGWKPIRRSNLVVKFSTFDSIVWIGCAFWPVPAHCSVRLVYQIHHHHLLAVITFFSVFLARSRRDGMVHQGCHPLERYRFFPRLFWL